MEERLDRFVELDDPLLILSQHYRLRVLPHAFGRVHDASLGVRPIYVVVQMFKTLALQRLYNLSDEALEFHINNRLSFQRFLRMHLASPIPNSSAI